MKKPDELKKRNERMSLYDLDTPAVRKGISGWKLTKRPIAEGGTDQMPLGIFPQGSTFEHLPQEPKRRKSRKRKGTAGRGGKDGDVTIDGRKI